MCFVRATASNPSMGVWKGPLRALYPRYTHLDLGVPHVTNLQGGQNPKLQAPHTNCPRMRASCRGRWVAEAGYRLVHAHMVLAVPGDSFVRAGGCCVLAQGTCRAENHPFCTPNQTQTLVERQASCAKPARVSADLVCVRR